MTLAYEAVYYDNGRVSVNSPTGFATDHYDRTPSPISLGGGGTRTLFGAGGVLAGVENVFGAVSSGQAFSSPENFVATAIRAVNTYQNTRALSNTGINQELQNMTVRGLTAASNQYVSGVNNTRFPISDINQNNSTQASARNLGR
jgi:hypothetical protein